MDNTVAFVAGRSSFFLTGGSFSDRVGAATGQQLSRTPLYLLNEKGEQPALPNAKGVGKLMMKGAKADVLLT